MKSFKIQYIFNGLIFAALTLIFGIYVGKAIPWHNDFLHGFFNIIIIFAFLTIIIHTLWECDERTPEEYQELLQKRFLPVKFPGRVTTLLIFIILGHQCILGGIGMQQIHNQNIVYVNQYNQKTQELQGLYDMTWKTISQKWKITDSAKSMGLQLTQAIYENKKAVNGVGFNLLIENKLIPVEEFTAFYHDLTTYVETQRAAYYSLEVQRQNIVAQQGILLETFPNNLYNKLLKIDKIQYKYGILSDSTENVFKFGKENF